MWRMESFNSVPKEWKMKEGSSGYNSKIYTQVDGKTCLFEIIIFFFG
jgi:hypothetical protein